ncbi:MAG: hypothetical protein JO079_08575 [Frankiaceae bacterium]|nr:hypothetical protein [Frankiaceae bacterium]
MLPALELLTTAENGDHLELHAGPISLGRTPPIDVEAIGTAERNYLVEYVRSLITLQRYAGRLLPIAEDPDPSDVEAVVNAAGVVEGRRMRLHANQLRVTLRGDRANNFLELVPNDEGALYITQSMGIIVGDVTLDLGEIATYAPQMRLSNRDEIVSSGSRCEDVEAIFECVDGDGIYWQRPLTDGA